MCRSGWVHWNGNCYKQNEDLLTWKDAEKKCVEFGGHLASVHSDQENNFIFLTSEKAVTWIGGNDLAKEDSWIWSDGSSWSYSNWQKGQPDNARGGGQNCLNIGFNAEKWDDEFCTRRFRSICKGEC